MTDISIDTVRIPDHVPPDLVWNGDMDRFVRDMNDPYLAAARLHDGPDIIWSPHAYRGSPGWILTRYALVRDAFMDHGHLSSASNSGAADLLGVDWCLNPLEIDPPAHTKYRQVLQPWFQPSAVNRMDAMVRGTCRSILDRFEGRQSCEFVEEFATQFPSLVFLSLMGLPHENLDQFLEWEHAFFRGGDIPTRVAGIRSIRAYMEDFLEKRRHMPAGDLGSLIANAEIQGRQLDHGEAMGMLMVLYLGGLDTVASSLGWHFRHLAQDQALQTRLRDHPEDIPGAVDEFLRAFGVTYTIRHVTEDFEFHGVGFKTGEIVVLPTYLASRDPREYADPHRIDASRKARHVTLATGVHNCLGIHLAKRELKIVMEEWLSRFSNIHIPEGETAEWHTEGVWGVARLPLAWDPA